MTQERSLIDIGVNLTDRRFDADRDQVLDRARKAGICCQILTGTSTESSREAIALAEHHPDLFTTVGVHPHIAKDFCAETLSEIRQLSEHPKAKAIGETGLDFNRDFSPRPAQEAAFEAQLQLACETGLPVFLHQRDAHERFFPVLKDYRDHLVDAVVHCFTDNRKALFDYLDLDCHIGVTGWLCDERRGSELRELVRHIPVNRLMIETDSPWLLPRNRPEKPPVRGRNEPALLPWILEQLTQCRDDDPATLAENILINSQHFFRLDAQATAVNPAG